MKRLFLAMIIFAGLFTSCKKVESVAPTYETYETYEIEGCEYIGGYLGYPSGYLTHKGNCKYCEERKEQSNTLTNQIN